MQHFPKQQVYAFPQQTLPSAPDQVVVIKFVLPQLFDYVEA